MKTTKQDNFSQRKDGHRAQLGEGTVVDGGVVLAYPPARGEYGPLIIGPNARIRHGTVIYAATCIGSHLETGHNVIIREENLIGDHLRIWSNSTIDYGCRIGHGVKIHHNVYVAQFTMIEDDVFVGPGVTITNDSHPGCPLAAECMQGPIIKKGAQIGAMVTVLPRVTIGEYALIGAGSVVTQDIPAGAVARGNPARVRARVQDLRCTTGLVDRPYGHLLGRLMGRLEDVSTTR